MDPTEKHIRELLELPVEDRARVAKILLDSLDDEGDDLEAEALKNAVLVARAKAVRSGSTELVEADEVRRRIAARLQDIRGS